MTFTDDDVVKLSIGLENRKPPIWLVEGLLEEGTLSSLVAPSGSYKSFMAIDIALSIAHLNSREISCMLIFEPNNCKDKTSRMFCRHSAND
jgi:hypothetical protein